MSEQLSRINKLIYYLPNKDIVLGHKFLKERDFESLKELVDSAIIKIKRNLNSESPKREYENINIENLNNLKSEVDVYLSILEPDSEEFNDYDTYLEEDW